ncbi:Trimeric GatFAB AmidoTransferase(AdT) complex subunit [Ceratobasidium sp. UAMH 11750]|nr:Trimeric GatFAB AmidoTransferase(AdT) complex subunit [Ceratobasidium sp. UAMH 11750]
MRLQRLARTTRLLQASCRQYRGLKQNLSRYSTIPNKDAWNAFTFRPDVASVGDPTNGQGLLAGKAIAVKDNICTADMPTTCSSKILQDFQPPYDATCVRLLREAGASIAGKTNCDEFGMGSLNVYSSHGAVVNPLSGDGEPRSAGGSSGGSAAAIAAQMCFAALGTDTGGSIRLPAAYCGVVGLKPSYGMISRWGVISYADSLDCVGVLASTVADAKTVYDAISHYDVRDPTSVPEDLRKSAHAAAQAQLDSFSSDTGNLSGIKIGIPQEYFPAELDQAALGPFRVLISSLTRHGAKIVPVSLPSTSYALSAYYVLASAEASSNLSRYDGIRYGSRADVPEGTDLGYAANAYAATRSAGFGDEAKKRILLGTYALSADAFENYFLQAQRVRALVRDDFNKVFGNRAPNLLQSSPLSSFSQGVDVLLHPSAIRTAPPLSSASESSIDAYVQDVLTVPASLAGLPALSVPHGKGADGWPLGASVVGQWGYDAVVCRVGQAIEACVKATEIK